MAEDADLVGQSEEAEDNTIAQDVPASARRLVTSQTDQKIIHIGNDFDRGVLHVQPSFQRKVVWESGKCSKLIESILLQVPIPVLYIAETEELESEVIDGQQRLAAILSFVRGGPLPGLEGRMWDGVLRGLKVLPELNGKRFVDLSRAERNSIVEFELRVIKIKRESHPDVKFEIFERLNTGSAKLNDMEIRNCIYRGPFNDLLQDLAENPKFRRMLGNKETEPRMKDVEMALRFIVLQELTERNYSGRMKTDLNHFMAMEKNAPAEKLSDWERRWSEAVEITFNVLGPEAFRRYVLPEAPHEVGHWETRKLNLSLFDTVMQNWHGYSRPQIEARADAIRELWIQVHTSPEFEATLARGADNKKNVEKRFRIWRTALVEAIGAPAENIRLFTAAFKRQLFAQEPTCRICGQQIHDVDDAEVDHILPWIRGGQTTAANARLAHRSCNRRRGARMDGVRQAPGHEAVNNFEEPANGAFVQQAVLHLLQQSPNGVTQAEVAEHVNRPGGQVNPILRKLIDAGKVYRLDDEARPGRYLYFAISDPEDE